MPIFNEGRSPREIRLCVIVRLIRSAFASKALGGHAFKREGKKRTPILKLKGATAIGGVLRREAEVDKIAGQLGDRVQQRFSSKLEYELNKLKSKLL